MRQLSGELRLSLANTWRSSLANRFGLVLCYVAAIGLTLVAFRDTSAATRLIAAGLVVLVLTGALAATARARWVAAIASFRAFETNGSVRVRAMVVADGPGAALTLDDAVEQANGWPAGQVAEVERMFTGLTSADLPFGIVSGYFVVEALDDSRILGVIIFDETSGPPFEPSIGFWLGPEARGAGIGLLAMPAFLSLIARTGVDRVYLGTAVDNTAMRRIATAAGGIEHEIRPHTLPNGDVVDSVWHVFHILPRSISAN